MPGEALFSALDGASTTAVEQGLNDVRKYLEGRRKIASARLGLHHARVRRGKFTFGDSSVTHLNGGEPPTAAPRDQRPSRLIHTGTCGAAESAETVRNRTGTE